MKWKGLKLVVINLTLLMFLLFSFTCRLELTICDTGIFFWCALCLKMPFCCSLKTVKDIVFCFSILTTQTLIPTVLSIQQWPTVTYSEVEPESNHTRLN